MTTCQHDPIGRLVYMTTMALKSYLENRVKPYDLTAEQFHVLKSLSEENGITQNKLCEMVMKSPANMTRILDRLEKKECIERRANPDDRRSTLVSLTPGGEDLLGLVRSELHGFEAEITAGLSGQQIQEIKDGLKIIHANIVELTGRYEK